MSDMNAATTANEGKSEHKKGEFAVPLSPSHTSPKHVMHHGHHHHFLVPSPIPCRRTRTISTSRLAEESDLQKGTIISFCREKGHGFVKPDDEEKPFFLHISDIEDEYVVRTGDRVQFRTIPIPPKRTEKMAVEVHLISLDESVPHERWDKQPDH